MDYIILNRLGHCTEYSSLRFLLRRPYKYFLHGRIDSQLTFSDNVKFDEVASFCGSMTLFTKKDGNLKHQEMFNTFKRKIGSSVLNLTNPPRKFINIYEYIT